MNLQAEVINVSLNVKPQSRIFLISSFDFLFDEAKVSPFRSSSRLQSVLLVSVSFVAVVLHPLSRIWLFFLTTGYIDDTCQLLRFWIFFCLTFHLNKDNMSFQPLGRHLRLTGSLIMELMSILGIIFPHFNHDSWLSIVSEISGDYVIIT